MGEKKFFKESGIVYWSNEMKQDNKQIKQLTHFDQRYLWLHPHLSVLMCTFYKYLKYFASNCPM